MSSCKHDETFKLVKCKTIHGHWQLRMFCLECESVYGNILPQSGTVLENIPEVVLDCGDKVKCAVVGCACTETALHHFMPRGLSVDSDLWPTARLCRKHHVEWHSVVTAGLCRKGWNG